MARSPVWHQLPPSTSHDVPNLLVSAEFSADTYVVRISDMANMWVEDMDRRAIYKRSLAEDTSIDPTDSPQNMQAFLSRIHSAFDASHEDHKDSHLGLSVGDGGALVLRITCEIPGLQPLVWPMSFKKCPSSQVGTKLVLPILQANLARIKQVDFLIEAIQQKDVVITKLLDKLEATGARLENIFTVLSAKHKVSRQTAEDKVKGLAPFKRDDWKAQWTADDEIPQDIPSLLRAVFEAPQARPALDLNYVNSPALDDWWERLTVDSVIPIGEPKRATSYAKEQIPPPKSAEAEDDDDFQIQSTPPHLSSARQRTAGKKPQPFAADDELTEDEEDEEEPPPQLPDFSEESEKRAGTARLGAIGSKTRPPPPTLPSSLPPDTSPAGSETESEKDDDDQTASLPPTSPPRLASSTFSSVSTKKKGLGRIGKAKVSEPVASEPQSPEAEANSLGNRPAARKLGQIGKKAAASGAPSIAIASRGRTEERTDGEAKPRETSEDRANRKRDELQKELQRKAIAGPARKKRKF